MRPSRRPARQQKVRPARSRHRVPPPRRRLLPLPVKAPRLLLQRPAPRPRLRARPAERAWRRGLPLQPPRPLRLPIPRCRAFNNC
ncbi:hypothetical protein CIW54_13890 [Paraburkholderia sp. T12-10]|nr:hypothetical protein CIW54_13890 [Paraburkholderia sp. T12-10]